MNAIRFHVPGIVTAHRLRELLHYEPETGAFTWRAYRNQHAMPGMESGRMDWNGYRSIRVDGRNYKAHRLAWLYVYGVWPSGQIDHINGAKDDNRAVNLRDVTQSGNQQNIRAARKNNASGMLGVYPQGGKWAAKICLERKSRYLGLFATKEQAHAAYLSAKRAIHPASTL